MSDLEEILHAALLANEESDSFGFKDAFDDSTQCWLDSIKDIAALANSGGGVIVFGLSEAGSPTGSDLSRLASLDRANIAEEFKRYTGVAPGRLEKRILEKGGQTIVALLVGPSDYPIPFSKSGTYPAPEIARNEGVKESTEFSRGTVYFRHGAKSETAEHADFVGFYERKLEQRRKVWLEGIRKVIETPEGNVPIVSYGDRTQIIAPDTSVRATKFIRTDPDQTHPYAPSEMLAALNDRIHDRRITNYDLLAIRYHHNLDSREEFVFRIHLSSPRYSRQFLEWIIACHEADPMFLESARAAYRSFLLSRKADARNRAG